MLETSVTSIEGKIIEHIYEMDEDIRKYTNMPEYRTELFKAKSIALQSLVELSKSVR